MEQERELIEKQRKLENQPPGLPPVTISPELVDVSRQLMIIDNKQKKLERIIKYSIEQTTTEPPSLYETMPPSRNEPEYPIFTYTDVALGMMRDLERNQMEFSQRYGEQIFPVRTEEEPEEIQRMQEKGKYTTTTVVPTYKDPKHEAIDLLHDLMERQKQYEDIIKYEKFEIPKYMNISSDAQQYFKNKFLKIYRPGRENRFSLFTKIFAIKNPRLVFFALGNIFPNYKINIAKEFSQYYFGKEINNKEAAKFVFDAYKNPSISDKSYLDLILTQNKYNNNKKVINTFMPGIRSDYDILREYYLETDNDKIKEQINEEFPKYNKKMDIPYTTFDDTGTYTSNDIFNKRFENIRATATDIYYATNKQLNRYGILKELISGIENNDLLKALPVIFNNDKINVLKEADSYFSRNKYDKPEDYYNPKNTIDIILEILQNPFLLKSGVKFEKVLPLIEKFSIPSKIEDIENTREFQNIYNAYNEELMTPFELSSYLIGIDSMSLRMKTEHEKRIQELIESGKPIGLEESGILGKSKELIEEYEKATETSSIAQEDSDMSEESAPELYEHEEYKTKESQKERIPSQLFEGVPGKPPSKKTRQRTQKLKKSEKLNSPGIEPKPKPKRKPKEKESVSERVQSFEEFLEEKKAEQSKIRKKKGTGLYTDSWRKLQKYINKWNY